MRVFVLALFIIWLKLIYLYLSSCRLLKFMGSMMNAYESEFHSVLITWASCFNRMEEILILLFRISDLQGSLCLDSKYCLTLLCLNGSFHILVTKYCLTSQCNILFFWNLFCIGTLSPPEGYHSVWSHIRSLRFHISLQSVMFKCWYFVLDELAGMGMLMSGRSLQIYLIISLWLHWLVIFFPYSIFSSSLVHLNSGLTVISTYYKFLCCTLLYKIPSSLSKKYI